MGILGVTLNMPLTLFDEAHLKTIISTSITHIRVTELEGTATASLEIEVLQVGP